MQGKGQHHLAQKAGTCFTQDTECWHCQILCFLHHQSLQPTIACSHRDLTGHGAGSCTLEVLACTGLGLGSSAGHTRGRSPGGSNSAGLSLGLRARESQPRMPQSRGPNSGFPSLAVPV